MSHNGLVHTTVLAVPWMFLSVFLFIKVLYHVVCDFSKCGTGDNRGLFANTIKWNITILFGNFVQALRHHETSTQILDELVFQHILFCFWWTYLHFFFFFWSNFEARLSTFVCWCYGVGWVKLTIKTSSCRLNSLIWNEIWSLILHIIKSVLMF